jgi:hypothetical protein
MCSCTRCGLIFRSRPVPDRFNRDLTAFRVSALRENEEPMAPGSVAPGGADNWSSMGRPPNPRRRWASSTFQQTGETTTPAHCHPDIPCGVGEKSPGARSHGCHPEGNHMAIKNIADNASSPRFSTSERTNTPTVGPPAPLTQEPMKTATLGMTRAPPIASVGQPRRSHGSLQKPSHPNACTYHARSHARGSPCLAHMSRDTPVV